MAHNAHCRKTGRELHPVAVWGVISR